MGAYIPDQLLEQYLLHELPPSQRDELERRIQADPDLQARLSGLLRSNEEILVQYPAAALAGQILLRSQSQGKEEPSGQTQKNMQSWTWRAVPAFSLALAALLALWAVPRFYPPERSQPLEITRSKGALAELSVFRKTASGVELLKPNSRAKKGDLLQIAYVALDNPFGVILSLDGRGTVTLHFPARPEDRPQLNPGQKTLLPTSYELDDAPDFERFFFVTSKHAFQTTAVLNAARQLAQNPQSARTSALRLPETLRQFSLMIEKDE